MAPRLIDPRVKLRHVVCFLELPATQGSPTAPFTITRGSLRPVGREQGEPRHTRHRGDGEPDPRRYAHRKSLVGPARGTKITSARRDLGAPIRRG